MFIEAIACSAARSREVRGSLRKNGIEVIIKNVRSVFADVELLCIVDGMEFSQRQLRVQTNYFFYGHKQFQNIQKFI